MSEYDDDDGDDGGGGGAPATFAVEVQERHGLFRNVPRFLTTAVRRKLAALERDPAVFDAAALAQRAKLKRLYALLHLRPGARAQDVLFGAPPAGSVFAALRELASAPPARAAELVRAHRIPMLAADAARTGGVDETVALALVETMPFDELIDRLVLLANKELLAGTVRTAVRARLDRMRERLRAEPELAHDLSYRKLATIARRAKLDRDLTEALFALLGDERDEPLVGDTAILVDASTSIRRDGDTLELAPRVAHLIDGALIRDAGLAVFRFDLAATALPVRRGADLAAWRALLAGGASDAGTSVGAAVAAVTAAGLRPERIVIVSDGFENRPPRIAGALEEHVRTTGTRPAICLVQGADAGHQLESDLRRASIAFEVFALDAHLVGLRALLPALRHGADDRLRAIAGWPLDE